MAILTKNGRSAIAEMLKSTESFVAWGSGDGAWGSTSIPPEDPNATALLTEVGRRKVTSIDFVVPDVDGEILIAGAGTFSVSATPTRQLIYTVKFDFADAPTATIRELGVFINVVVDPLLPSGQKYFTPDQIDDSGDLLELEHRAPIVRSAGDRSTFYLLITL